MAFSIPEIDTTDRSHILPIHKQRLLKNVDPMVAYPWGSSSRAEGWVYRHLEISMPRLRCLAKFKTLHTFSYGGFKPSVDEVWCQIPEEFVKEGYAFELRAEDDPEALGAGFHLATCTLYALHR